MEKIEFIFGVNWVKGQKYIDGIATKITELISIIQKIKFDLFYKCMPSLNQFCKHKYEDKIVKSSYIFKLWGFFRGK